MTPLILWALKATGLLAQLADGHATDELKAAVKELVAQLNTSLPMKEDGTPYTDEDLAALKAQHDALTAGIRNRHDNATD